MNKQDIKELIRGKDLIKVWNKEGYSLRLYTDYSRGDYGKTRITYVFRDKGEVIFLGSDFYPSPMRAIDSLYTVYDLLSFLSLQEGDTDSEHFESYTERQLEWRDSSRAEELSYLVYIWEEMNGVR